MWTVLNSCRWPVVLAVGLLCLTLDPALAHAVGGLDRSETVTWIDTAPTLLIWAASVLAIITFGWAGYQFRYRHAEAAAVRRGLGVVLGVAIGLVLVRYFLAG
jgi:hypothetical protein